MKDVACGSDNIINLKSQMVSKRDCSFIIWNVSYGICSKNIQSHTSVVLDAFKD